MKLSLFRCLLVSAVVATLANHSSAQRITLPNGATVTGTLETNVANQPVQVFRGIPYAEPPTGERRWKQSVVKPVTGDVNATAFGSICYGYGGVDWQSNAYAPSEDCLFLNVYAPAGVTSQSKLPVMVWIHGGALVSGASNAFDGSNLIAAADNQIVYVSINYRLSIFGFLSGDVLKKEGEGVNYGLRDQETAFAWIKQHIQHFGGNPDDITAFGESAGAKSVFMHLISRDGKQSLFHKAIAESGTYITAHDIPTRAKQNNVTSQISETVGCSTAGDDAAVRLCLRSATTSAVWAAGGTLSWQPVVDDVFLLDSPIRRVLSGKVSRIPTIFGTNTDEGYGFIKDSINKAEDVIPYMRKRFSLLTDPEFSKLDELYPAANFASPKHRAGEMYSDVMYVCPSEFASLQGALRGKTFRYRFNETATTLGPPLVLHTAELNYVFNNVSMLAQDSATQGLVRNVQRYWTNFARTKSPNGDDWLQQFFKPNGGPLWPQYDPIFRLQIVLQSSKIQLERTGAYMPLHDERCAFWNSVELRLAPTLAA